MDIGFSGTRSKITLAQKESIKKIVEKIKTRYKSLNFHQGDCVGADQEITELLLNEKLISKLSVHPPSNSSLRAFIVEKIKNQKNNSVEIEVYPEKDYLDRNKEIIEVSKLLIICPKTENEELRSGTWATYRTAKKFNKKIFVVFPSGRTEIWPDKNLINKIKKNINKGKKINEAENGNQSNFANPTE